MVDKKNISSVEVAALVSEMQCLVGGKVSQIYQLNKKEFLLQLFARNVGKKLLKIHSGKWLNFTTKKDTPQRPTGYCMLLRKHISNSLITSIKQRGSERIVVITFEKFLHGESEPKTYHLIIELFSRGNVVFTNSDFLILGTLGIERSSTRQVSSKRKFEFLKASFNWKETSKTEFVKTITTSDKKNIATSLATDIGLGGVYAKELCERSQVDPNKEISEFTKTSIENLFNELVGIRSEVSNPKGFMYESSISPIPFKEKIIKKEYDSYSELLDQIELVNLQSPYKQRIARLKNIIEKQEKALLTIDESINKNNLIAEKIYEFYPQLQQLLSTVTDLKKTKEWSEIKKELSQIKKITSINLKSKTIEIEL